MVGYYRISLLLTRSATAVDDLIADTRALERRAVSVGEHYVGIMLPAGWKERERFISDRLSLPLDRYDILNAYGRIDIGKTPQDIPWIDRAAQETRVLRLPSFDIKGAPVVAGGTFLAKRGPRAETSAQLSSRDNVPAHVIHRELWPNVQLDYRSDLLHEVKPSDFGAADPRWSYHRESRVVQDIAGSKMMLWLSAVTLSLIVWTGMYLTMRFLFFVGFRPPQPIPVFDPGDLELCHSGVLLLKIAGQSLQYPSCGTPAPTLLDLRAIRTLEDVPRLAGSKSIVILDNFEFTFDSEAQAAAHLWLIEGLVLSKSRPFVIVSMTDPLDHISEIESDDPASAVGPDWFPAQKERWNRVFLCLTQRRLDFARCRNTEEGDAYARHIFASCTETQRAILYQISHGGWVNPNNKRALAGLIRRGWVTMKPTPVFAENMSFLMTGVPLIVTEENLDRWNSSGNANSSWITTLLIAMLAIVAVALGPDLLQNDLPGKITAIITGIPIVWKGISTLRARNGGPEREEVNSV